MKLEILVLGGTGAIGHPLVKKLSERNVVYVTSRKEHISSERVKYVKGDAHQEEFLRTLLDSHRFDAIVDFMVWKEDFSKVLPLLLSHTKQYVFVSSARVYAQSEERITEDSPRLLDVCADTAYLKTNEYGLAKAREEDMLRQSGCNNYTIVRPSITYHTYRLQLGVLEKENWLYRCLHGRSIVFSKDIVDKLTTMTSGDDVAAGMAALVGEEDALGRTFHITYPRSLTWQAVLDTYVAVLEEYLGHQVKVVMTEKSVNLKIRSLVYQVIYCRYFNRTFNNDRIGRYCDVSRFTAPEQGLASCLREFLEKPVFRRINWEIEAYNDMAAGESTPLGEIAKTSDKIYYLAARYHLPLVSSLMHRLANVRQKLCSR